MIHLTFEDLPNEYQTKINQINSRFIQSLYSENLFKFKYLKIGNGDEKEGIVINDNQVIVRFLYQYLSNFKFLVFNLSENNQQLSVNGSSATFNDKNDGEIHSFNVDTFFCVENELIVVDQISIELIKQIYHQLNKANCSVINISEYSFDDDNETINIINEVKQDVHYFCTKFSQSLNIKNNEFVYHSSMAILGYLIRRNYYPAHFFKKPNFFNDNNDQFIIKEKLQKIIFASERNDIEYFNDSLSQINDEIEKYINKKETIPNQTFSDGDFIKFKSICTTDDFAIFLAMHRQTFRLYVLKMINEPSKIENENIKHETEFCSEYSNRCLTKFYGFFKKQNDIIGFVYEFMSNGTLENFVVSKQFDQTSFLIAINRIYQGILYFHSKSLIHRDLKPINILIDNNFTPYISDYDRVRKVMQNDSYEDQTQDIGSPLYYAPEQYGEGAIVSFPADVFAFGLLIYFMNTKKHFRNTYKIGKDQNYLLPNASDNINTLFKLCVKQNQNDRIKTEDIKRYIIDEVNSFSYFEQILLSKNINEAQFVNFIYEYIIINQGNQEKLSQLYERIYFFSNFYLSKKFDDESIFYLNLGVANMIGFGNYNPPNYKKAEEYYEKSAQLNNPQAQCNLGHFYANNMDGKHNYLKSKKYFELAALNNESSGLNGLGILYSKGLGVEQSFLIAKSFFEKSALQNNPEAFYNLGIMYENGFGVKKDIQIAKNYYELSAQQNNPNAFFSLGSLYYEGEYIKQDYSKAKSYFELSARFNNPEAYLHLGYIYENGFGVKPDYSIAKECYEKSASFNNPDALFHLAEMFFKGLDSNQNMKIAREYYERAAQLNQSDAMVSLSAIYMKGLGVKKEYNMARRYCEQAAKLHNPDALFNLGTIYQCGYGVDIDYAKAKKYFELAVEYEHQMAYYYLGCFYKNGLGCQKDIKQAIHYFELSATLGNSDAMNNLGNIYKVGKDIPKDYKKALNYFDQSAKLGNSYALTSLGMMYQNGLYLQKDILKAIKYYEKAIEQDNPIALKMMGDIYKGGLCVEKDYLKAKEYYERSANLGNADGLKCLGDMYYFGYGCKVNYLLAKDCYERSAQKNNSGALYFLGNIYYFGTVGKIDYEKAKEYYELSANQNNSDALYYLGQLYANENYIYKNYSKAKYYYELAAKLKNKNAIYSLGYLYRFGNGVNQDIQTAIKYYKIAANMKSSDALYALGYLYEKGNGVEKNYQTAIQYYESAAKLNNKKAYFALGAIYQFGDGIKPDYEKSKNYYEKALELGNIVAAINLGELYENNFNPKDYEKAKEYYLLATKKNNPVAFKNLGDMYLKGLLGAIDYELARQNYEKSAMHNYTGAFLMLGKIYKKALGVKQDYVRAKNYYELAIQNKNPDGFLKLGYLYENGLGVNKDYIKAKKYYESAANANKSKAFLKLGNFYLNGLGVKRDILQAIKNYKYSADLNNSSALFILGNLYSTGDILPINIQVAIQYFLKCIKLEQNIDQKTHNIFDKSRFIKKVRNRYYYHACNDLGLIYFLNTEQNIELTFDYIKEAAFAEYPFAQYNFGLLLKQYHKDEIGNIEHMFQRAAEHNFALAEYNLGKIREDENKINESIEFYIKASDHEDEPLVFHNMNHFDKRLEISKTFIICMTNLKITKYYLEKDDRILAKEYFIKSLLKISQNKSYKFLFTFPEDKTKNKFSYLKTFILNYPEFNMINQPNLPSELIPILKTENEKIQIHNYETDDQKGKLKSKDYFDELFEVMKTNNKVFDKVDDLFDYAIEAEEIKLEFLFEIDDIINTMNSILYTPPYGILFGRINLEKKKQKQFINNINSLFYEGFGINFF